MGARGRVLGKDLFPKLPCPSSVKHLPVKRHMFKRTHWWLGSILRVSKMYFTYLLLAVQLSSALTIIGCNMQHNMQQSRWLHRLKWWVVTLPLNVQGPFFRFDGHPVPTFFNQGSVVVPNIDSDWSTRSHSSWAEASSFQCGAYPTLFDSFKINLVVCSVKDTTRQVPLCLNDMVTAASAGGGGNSDLS